MKGTLLTARMIVTADCSRHVPGLGRGLRRRNDCGNHEQGHRDGHERCTMIWISHRAALPRSGRSGQSLVRYGPGLWSSRDRPPGASTGGRLSQPGFPALGSDLSGAPKETGRRWDNQVRSGRARVVQPCLGDKVSW
jgi:hypothetical protein